MASDEKVVIQLVLDDKDFKKVSSALPGKFNSTGKESGRSFSRGFESGLSTLKNTLTAPLRFIKGEFLALGTAIAGGFLFKKAIDEAKTLESSLIGVTTVTNAFGGSVSEITSQAKRLAADGLIPLSDVTGSLKNLVATFDGDIGKAVSTFESFRDAAAFNRQETLSLGEAIRSASEGLKNDLSIKTDNIGITKNLSVLQKEYAASIGSSIGKLTEAQKAQAKYLGIQREGAVFQGDYNKLLNTFDGATSKLAGSFRFLLAEFGSIITKSPFVVKVIKDIADQLIIATGEVKKFGAGDGFKRIALGAVAIGESLNKYVIQPIEFLADVLGIVQNSFQVFFQSIITGFGAVGGAIAKIANAVGLDNGFTEGLKAFEEVSFEQLNIQLDEFSAKADSAFGFEASDKVASFFDGLNTKILETAPVISSLGTSLDKADKGLSGLSDSAQKNGKAINNAINNSIAKSASQGIQSLTKSLLLGEDGFANFGKSIAKILGDMAVQLGETLILSGLGIEALKSLGGAGAIAAGAGLIALGTILKSFSGGGGTSASAGTVGGNFTQDQASTIGGEEPVEREEAKTGVVVNIQGDVLDSTETGLRVVDIINKAYDQEGVVINRGAIA